MVRHLKNPTLILLVFLLLGFLSRFINLSWGAPYFFHPDERNIAHAISQLSFPSNLNPHFFAYGSLPIYLAFFTGMFSSFLSTFNTVSSLSFEQSLLILRFFSASLSVLLIFLLYSVGEILKNKRVGLLAAFFGTTSIGLIQYGHFGTFEMWLTTGSLLMFLFGIRYIKSSVFLNLLGIILSFALLISTKVSSLVLLPFLLLFLIIPVIKKQQTKRKALLYLFITLLSIFTIYLATNPFTFLDYQSFINSISYESAVAMGNTKVFYTGEFFQAPPVIFPFIKIYPFLLNPILFILFLPSLFIVSIIATKKRSVPYFFLLCFFLVLFFSQTVLYAQWTRYFIPTLPFIFLIIAIGVDEVLKRIKSTAHQKIIQSVSLCFIIFVSVLMFFAFIKTVYLSGDTRVIAKEWAVKHIPPEAPILSEVYDLGVTPFNEVYYQISLFNFYDLDNNSIESNEKTFASKLETTEYILLPSQRIQKSRLLNNQQFPYGNKVYTEIFNGTLGFNKIYETSCDIWCNLVYWGNPVYSFEQTTAIFDRPTIIIFTKEE